MKSYHTPRDSWGEEVWQGKQILSRFNKSATPLATPSMSVTVFQNCQYFQIGYFGDMSMNLNCWQISPLLYCNFTWLHIHIAKLYYSLNLVQLFILWNQSLFKCSVTIGNQNLVGRVASCQWAVERYTLQQHERAQRSDFARERIEHTNIVKQTSSQVEKFSDYLPCLSKPHHQPASDDTAPNRDHTATSASSKSCDHCRRHPSQLRTPLQSQGTIQPPLHFSACGWMPLARANKQAPLHQCQWEPHCSQLWILYPSPAVKQVRNDERVRNTTS